jgi:hypothetical protein
VLHYYRSSVITIDRSIVPSQPNSINLIYIKAAIEAATGVSLKPDEIRQYLLEEGLITPTQARKEATVFRGYSEFYDYDYGEIKDEQEPKELNFEQQNLRQRYRVGEENL